MAINPKIGLTFAAGLRSFLRQDPDVIMVGEIRDKETAEIAIQASLTGHLVFSTVHTNDAAGAVTRLVDMGVEPFLVASSLTAMLAQRLVRRVCPDCREPYTPTDEELKEIGLTARRAQAALRRGRTIYQAEGCADCNRTGYRGRTGIYELLLVDDDIRQLMLKNVDSSTIKKAAVEQGHAARCSTTARARSPGRDHHRRGAQRHPGRHLTRPLRGPGYHMPVFEYRGLNDGRQDRQGPARGGLAQDAARAAAQGRRVPHRGAGPGRGQPRPRVRKGARRAAAPRREVNFAQAGRAAASAPTTSPSPPASSPRCWARA